MANEFYGSGGTEIASGNINWLTDTFKVQLCDSNYVFDRTAHNNFSDVTVGGRVGTSVTVTNPTLVEGKLDADDVIFSAVGGGVTPPTITHYVLYKDTGLEATSTLLAHFDASTGLPVLTNGGDITIQWDSLGVVQL